MHLARVALADGGVAFEPAVGLARAKQHLDVTFDGDDAKIEALIRVAQAHLEGHDGTGGVLGRAVSRHTLDLMLPAFPQGAIALPQPPVTAVVSVSYVNSAGVTQTLATDTWALVPGAVTPSIMPAANCYWPATATRWDAVRVRHQVGLTETPIDLEHAILMHVFHLYQNPSAAGDNVSVLPLAYQAIVSTHKTHGWR